MRGLIGTRNIAGAIRGSDLVTAVLSDSPWGNTLYVQSTHIRASDSNRTGQDIDFPLATLKRALAICNDGDVILVGESHVEDIIDVTNWVLANSGVHVVGLGFGDNRPTFTLTTSTSAAMKVTGPGNRISNCRFICGVDGCTNVLRITSAAIGTLIHECEFGNVTAMQATTMISATAADIHVVGCRTGDNTATAGSLYFIALLGDRGVVRDCYIRGDYSSTCVFVDGVSADVEVCNNLLENTNAVDVCIKTTDFANSGWIANNYMRIATDAELTWITQGTASLVQLAQNFGVNDNQETGILEGTASI
jgi:hypothetical protein